MKTLLLAALGSMLVSLSFGQDMVKIAGGTFMMGSGTTKINTWTPVHSVTLSPFAIDKYEVTFELWTKVRNWGLLHGYTDLEYGLNGCKGDGNTNRLPAANGANNPATCLLWYDAVKWCNARSEMDSLAPVYFTDNTLSTVYRTGQLNIQSDAVDWTGSGYRLPTEAEWEFAARGGTRSGVYIYSGSNTLDAVAWDAQNSGISTHPVGLKAANELGIFDMTGNVSEWCWDWCKEYDGGAQTNPRGATLLPYQMTGLYHRVVRGCNYSGTNWFAVGFDSYAVSIRADLVENAWWGFVGLRCVGDWVPKLSIIKPAVGELVRANSSYPIEWNSTDVDSVKIEYSVDNGTTYLMIANNVDANADNFLWTSPDSLLSTRCRIKITDMKDSTNYAESGRFKMKGYVITRMTADGNFEAFSPDVHGWNFHNDSTSMWPKPWWAQFDYAGIDPNTGGKYFAPWAFSSGLPIPKSQDFIDWPLFVDVFQAKNCYKGEWVTSRAFFEWYSLTGKWNGSCSGFAISAFLAFNMPAALQSKFPSIGSFDSLHQVVLNPETRKILNQLSWYQFDPSHRLYESQHSHRTPRETLQDLKDMFFPGGDDNRFVTIYIPHPCFCHAVNGYKLEVEEPATGLYEVYVYDSNVGRMTARIDSTRNVWGSKSWGEGLYLSDPVSTYLNDPQLVKEISPVPVAPAMPLARTNGTQASGVGALELFTPPGATVLITDKGGTSIGFADSGIVGNMAGAVPLLPFTGEYHPPFGFYVPGGSYAIHLAGFPDSSSYFTAIGDTMFYAFRRGDARNDQSDNLHLADGLSVTNPDPALKDVDLRTVVSTTTVEKTFSLQHVGMFAGDSLVMQAVGGSDLVFVNAGRSKTYDLNLVLVSDDSHGLFNHPSIHIDSNTTHHIIPSWDFLADQPVKILIDQGNHGTFRDSIFVNNQTSSVSGQFATDIPSKIALLQNFPNPFNPTTTIRYGLPSRSHVMLTVYNTLGQQVALLQNGEQDAGYHEVKFDASGLSSGVYFYRIEAGSFVETRKLLLLR
jgi:formylglycine-generating enzyme required for sulfatase activity